MIPAGWQLQPGGLERFFGHFGSRIPTEIYGHCMALYGNLWLVLALLPNMLNQKMKCMFFFVCVCACVSTAKWTQSDAKEPETIGNYSSAGIVIIHFVFFLLGITTYPGPANV